MKYLVISAACATVLFMTPGALRAAERTAWQAKAELAVHKVVTDEVAEKFREILYPVGKNGQVKSIIVEPDGNGVIAKINIKWSGVVIAIEYGATVRWRFTPTDHLNSDVEKAIGFGVVTDKSKRELDDYLRTKIYPLVQAEAAK